MFIIQRPATANYAEYGHILAHMGPLFAEIGLQSGPISAPGDELGATTGRKTAPSADCIAGSPPGGDFYVSGGTNGWRCPKKSDHAGRRQIHG